jgi:hypothetical protein
MSYDHFTTTAQVVSWCKYMLDTGLCMEKDLTFQKMLSAAKLRDNNLCRSVAYETAAMLAARHPDEYTAWCALQKLTGKRK